MLPQEAIFVFFVTNVIAGTYILGDVRSTLNGSDSRMMDQENRYDNNGDDLHRKLMIDTLQDKYDELFDEIKRVENNWEMTNADANISREYKNEVYYEKERTVDELKRKQKDILCEIRSLGSNDPSWNRKYSDTF